MCMTSFEGAVSKGVNGSPEDVLRSFQEVGEDGDNEWWCWVVRVQESCRHAAGT